MNAWSYSLLFLQHETLSTSAIREVLQLIVARGYSATNPLTGFVEGMKSGGMEEFEFRRLPETVEFLNANGGLLYLWKTSADIWLWFDPPSATARWAESNLEHDGEVILKKSSISVEETCFWPDNPDRWEIAADLQQLFIQLCGYLDAPYGYSSDENATEALASEMSQMNVYEDVRSRHLPAVLFWLQYFSDDYAVHLDLGALADLGGIVQQLPSGVLVKFFDYPWNVNLDVLVDINRKWRKFIKQKPPR